MFINCNEIVNISQTSLLKMIENMKKCSEIN